MEVAVDYPMLMSQDQEQALEVLNSKANIFLTGRAGTGKSTILKKFLQQEPKGIAVLASTGAAAILVGGRTFHSFFSLGILEGGRAKTVERAAEHFPLKRRLKKINTIIIDEISMLSGETLATAEEIARKVRGNEEPWGNMRVIAVGDFAQLPPISKNGEKPDWAFQHEVWARTNFKPVFLTQIHRSHSSEWTKILQKIREGQCDREVSDFLNKKTRLPPESKPLTRLFALRHEAESYNLKKLAEIASPSVEYETDYKGDARYLDQLRKNAPIPEVLVLKEGALVMLRKNDPDGLYVNGSLAKVVRCEKKKVEIELLQGGITLDLEVSSFELLDADGNTVAAAKNFPLSLAYGSTIHKSQGSTLDALQVKLTRLWESGHAYVALSRIRDPDQLYLDSWDANSIKISPDVQDFYARIGEA